MTENEDESSDSPQRGNSIINGWKPDDTKLLVVTIAGAVIANIITVVIVALAIIAARSFRPQQLGAPTLAYVLPLLFSVPVAMFFWWTIVRYQRRRSRSGYIPDNISRIIYWITIIVLAPYGLASLVYTLAIIGWAVGVK